MTVSITRCHVAGTGKNQHVLKREDGSAVLGEGNSKDTSHHRTQKEAAEAARPITHNQKIEVFIHGKDNKIRARDSYGKDARPPKDEPSISVSQGRFTPSSYYF
ncbi:DUF2188 domain-containing protein [Pseudomonas putida]|uniref:DUF2188 domain-containing protein n=1 Tax=Pseudomonas putida TaxID=303 RepID=UPI000D3B9B11|nr:DUF2188 domain-containing protein [Pseudomonas putida]PTV59044.1 hypothetical protein DBL05_12600 [Pseudomonas putida]